MAWRVELDPAADKELARLDPAAARRILRFLSERVTTADDPRSLGLALKGARLGGLWRYRIGAYRVIVLIEDGPKRVLVLRVGHRAGVYG